MGFFEKIRNGLARTKQSMAVSMNNMFASFTGENEEFFDDLEEILITSDVGEETSMGIVDRLRAEVRKNGLRGEDEVRHALETILTDMLPAGELELTTKPSVILVTGVNGVGKTTTIGKLAIKRGEIYSETTKFLYLNQKRSAWNQVP